MRSSYSQGKSIKVVALMAIKTEVCLYRLADWIEFFAEFLRSIAYSIIYWRVSRNVKNETGRVMRWEDLEVDASGRAQAPLVLSVLHDGDQPDRGEADTPDVPEVRTQDNVERRNLS